ncbi:MAG: MFS transporter [Acidimicrobiales bacterium]|nr:MFS transporter [Acidimicrobiales bacterium]
MDAAAIDEERPDRRAWIGLIAASAAATVVAINQAGINLAFTELEQQWPDTPRSVLSWTISAYSIGLASFLLVGGRLADRLGRRKVLLAASAVFLVASVASAAAPSVGVLIATRFVAAAAAAFTLPASLSVALPMFPTAFRGRVVATWASANAVGAASGPSLSALAIEWFSWRAVFLLGVPVLAFMLVAGPRLLPESRAPVSGRRLDYLGVALGTVAVAGLVFAISQGSTLGRGHPTVLLGLAIGLAGIPLLWRRCLHHPEPLLDPAVLRLRTVWSANVANLFLSAAGMSIWLVWPLFVSRMWGYSPLRTGLAISAGPANNFVWATVAGRLNDRYGPRGLISVGSLLPLCGIVWFVTQLGPEPNYVRELLPGILLFSSGFGLTFSPLNTAALVGVPDAAFGQVNAAFNTARHLASALGAATIVAIVGTESSLAVFDRAFLFLGVCTVVGAAVIWFVYPHADSAAVRASRRTVPERRPAR